MNFYKKNLVIIFSFMLIILLNLNTSLYAQPKSIREERPVGVYLQLFGPTVMGLNLNYHFSNLFDGDFGFGIDGDLQLGIRYFPFGDKVACNLFPYVGLFSEMINEFKINIFNTSTSSSSSTIGFYIPIGVEWYVYKGLTLSIEAGYNNTREEFNQVNTKRFNGAFRIGYHFSL